MGKIIIIMAMMLVPYAASAQHGTRVVYGQTRTLNDLPVSGITVSARNAKSSTVSDSLGNFMIVCNDKDRLSFTAKVFRTANVKVNAKTPDTVNVNMAFVNNEKNVELAIGYGYIQEKYRTQAIEYSKHKLIYSSYTNIYELLRNEFPTLQVQDNGCVVIRGPSSFNASNCALYIVDNMKTDNIDYIVPSTVKEISVLKDASSCAIYGCESTNGVIIINLISGTAE